uniref:Uncharacterized protein n=1 Tax=Tanacetum cinerariifolium TaxID=118510 RepID=A0A699GHI8_TANCI|nr:hypothetical protein [Tanacetum cinerariifolium]
MEKLSMKTSMLSLISSWKISHHTTLKYDWSIAQSEGHPFVGESARWIEGKGTLNDMEGWYKVGDSKSLGLCMVGASPLFEFSPSIFVPTLSVVAELGAYGGSWVVVPGLVVIARVGALGLGKLLLILLFYHFIDGGDIHRGYRLFPSVVLEKRSDFKTIKIEGRIFAEAFDLGSYNGFRIDDRRGFVVKKISSGDG